MANKLIQHIAESLKSYSTAVFLVENNDRFLYRPDVVAALKEYGVEVASGTNIAQRIKFEMKEEDGLLILLTQNASNYLEDIKQQSTSIEFRLVNYLQGYHIPSVIDLDLELIDHLYRHKQFVSLNRNETLQKIQKISDEQAIEPHTAFNLPEFEEELNKLLSDNTINWSVLCRHISNGILATIGSPAFEDMLLQINNANDIFQKTLQANYKQVKNSSAVKKPRIVSRILDYLHFNHRDNKIALIVIDGLAFWQYQLLKEKLPNKLDEDVILSWLPSITQLSRQAIFRGGIPRLDYKQNPQNESKLWKSFWMSNGFQDFEISYQYEKADISRLDAVSKLAIVFKDLDDKMHTSTDYADLLGLTKNWIERSKILSNIHELLHNGFRVFLTTDHGNIQAKGWRGLKGREKLGTNKSGSRSQRHIEYTEKWLFDEFVENNPDLKDLVFIENHAIYHKTDLSFSSKESLVTHGGAHLLEVLIPFIEIRNES